ncbi:aromatic prenyltransferase [Cadophora sp. DSE1049]|nr:aromatic prenyltransferase [Cadophora sp. DSE1049]
MIVQPTLASKPTSDTQEHVKPWQALSQSLTFQSLDQKLWWEALGAVAGASMSRTGYSIEAQYKNLLLIYSTLIPSLGPYYACNQASRTWIDCMANPDGPLDISVNYQENSKCAFRMTIEPVGIHAGTQSDPVNELAAKQLLQNLDRIQPGADLSWFDHFEQVVVKNCDARQHRDTIQLIGCKSQHVVGVDFQDGLFMVKAYVSPLLSSAMTGKNFLEVMFGSLRTLSEEMNLNLDLKLVEEYLTGKDGVLGEKTYVSFDCKSPSESRIKIYSAMWVSSLNEVRDLWTLGGRLAGSMIEDGFAVVKKAWHLLLPRHLPNGDQSSRITVNFNWELSPKDGSISPKLYFLVDEDFDEHVSSAVVSLFNDLGWTDNAETHLSLEKEVYSIREFNGRTNVYIWLAIAYSAKGPYITVYSNPLEGAC